MTSTYILDEETRAVMAAYRTLVDLGVLTEGQEDQLNALASAVYAQGWRYGLDFLDGSFRAEILLPAAHRQGNRIQAHGPTMEGALALALASALTRTGALGE
jgi:hypothetical protein